MKDHLVGLESATGRLSGAARAAESQVAQAERVTQSMTSLSGALSGLADRVNLVALNVTLLATKSGEAGMLFEPSGVELRGLFEEARRLSRDLGSQGPRAQAAARHAVETLGEVAATADGTTEKAQRAAVHAARLGDLTARLEETLSASRREAEAAEERGAAMERRLLGTEAAAAARSAALGERLAAFERFASDVRGALEGVRQARSEADDLVERLRPA